MRQSGYTLLEVMIALGLFALMAAGAYATLNNTLISIEAINAQTERVQRLQRALQTLGDDFSQLQPRPVRDELGQGYVPALEADPRSEFLAELSRGGWRNPLTLPRPTLQRVAYRVEDNELIRYHWRVLDRTLANEPVELALLDGVEALRVRYLVGEEWSEEWPPRAATGAPGLRLRPRAVEITLELEDLGELRRLVEVTG